LTTAVANPRTIAERTADAIARLEAPNGDVWVATASPTGEAFLVPLSYAWDGEHVILAAQASSATARNLRSSRQARLGFGATRDVVLVDAELVRTVEIGDTTDAAASAVGERYATQADWDPREEPSAYVFLLLRPRRVQAWREANELEGRLVMRNGTWLGSPTESRANG
jgi:Pyridoxamine 5'-phosphate oxidase